MHAFNRGVGSKMFKGVVVEGVDAANVRIHSHYEWKFLHDLDSSSQSHWQFLQQKLRTLH